MVDEIKSDPTGSGGDQDFHGRNATAEKLIFRLIDTASASA
jgi:hypothetical protein